ncbi:Plug domain-containing protein [Chryseobacterium tructae]|uniref:Plug domain-containing protein n=1 Tax=Chryseobacterium tructae TaxID=1037380 RepID=UPI003390690A
MKKNFCSLSHVQMAFGLVLLMSCSAIGQVREISGTVIGKSGALIGVSVFQEGTDQKVVTGSAGGYTIKVTGKNPVLVFRYDEYPLKKVKLEDSDGVGEGNRIGENNTQGKKIINVTLSGNSEDTSFDKTQVTGIGEIVLNAGYYKVKEKESTGSIARVGAKEIGNQPVTNVLSAVQGRVTGVSITQSSGVAGGGYDIQIRGRTVCGI